MLARFIIDVQGHFFGIGVQIRRNNTKDMLQVVTPLKGSPAYDLNGKSRDEGMQAGDIITNIVREVDNEGKRLPQPETISTKGMSTEDAVKEDSGQGKYAGPADRRA